MIISNYGRKIDDYELLLFASKTSMIFLLKMILQIKDWNLWINNGYVWNYLKDVILVSINMWTWDEKIETLSSDTVCINDSDMDMKLNCKSFSINVLEWVAKVDDIQSSRWYHETLVQLESSRLVLYWANMSQ